MLTCWSRTPRWGPQLWGFQLWCWAFLFPGNLLALLHTATSSRWGFTYLLPYSWKQSRVSSPLQLSSISAKRPRAWDPPQTNYIRIFQCGLSCGTFKEYCRWTLNTDCARMPRGCCSKVSLPGRLNRNAFSCRSPKSRWLSELVPPEGCICSRLSSLACRRSSSLSLHVILPLRVSVSVPNF